MDAIYSIEERERERGSEKEMEEERETASKRSLGRDISNELLLDHEFCI